MMVEEGIALGSREQGWSDYGGVEEEHGEEDGEYGAFGERSSGTNSQLLIIGR